MIRRQRQGAGPGTAPGTTHPSFKGFKQKNNVMSLDSRSLGMNSTGNEPKLTLE